MANYAAHNTGLTMSYSSYQVTLKSSAPKMPDIPDGPVMKMTQSLKTISPSVEQHLTTTVARTAFKSANDNKAHYEALCRKIQENERRAAPVRQQEKKQDEPEQDALDAADVDPEPEPDAAEASAADVLRTESELQQIYSYIMEQSFEAQRAQEFLHYMMEQQAMQFAMQPLPGQNVPAQPQQHPQLNFVAIQQMHDNIPHLMSPQMQHDQRGLFAQNAFDMNQPVHSAMAAPVQKNEQKAAPHEKLAPHIERELSIIALGSQFDAQTVKAATDQLQFNQQAPTMDTPSDSTPETGSSADATSQQQPPKAANGAGASAPTGGNNEIAVSLIQEAMKQNALAEEAKLKNGNATYIPESRIQIVYTGGAVQEKTQDSSLIKTKAERDIKHTADGQDKNASLTRQFNEFTNIGDTITSTAADQTKKLAAGIQADESVANTYVLSRDGVLIDKPVATGKRSADSLNENTQDLVGKNVRQAMQKPLLEFGNVPGFSMNIAS